MDRYYNHDTGAVETVDLPGDEHQTVDEALRLEDAATGRRVHWRGWDPAIHERPQVSADAADHAAVETIKSADKATLEAMAAEAGLDVEGTGADGAVLARDLREALIDHHTREE